MLVVALFWKNAHKDLTCANIGSEQKLACMTVCPYCAKAAMIE
jgi:hypothetical protein